MNDSDIEGIGDGLGFFEVGYFGQGVVEQFESDIFSGQLRS